MSDEYRNAPSKESVENTVAISKLIAISERTTVDVDKIVKHIEKFLPVHTKLDNLKTIVYSATALFGSFAVWTTLMIFGIQKDIAVCTVEWDSDQAILAREIVVNKEQLLRIKGKIPTPGSDITP